MQGPKAYPPTTRLAPHGMWMSHLPPGLGLRCSLLQEFCSLRSSPTPGCASLTSVWSLAPSLRPICTRSALPAPSLSRSPGGRGLDSKSQKALRFPWVGPGLPLRVLSLGGAGNFQILALSGRGGDCWAQTPHPKCHPAPPSPRSGHPEEP